MQTGHRRADHRSVGLRVGVALALFASKKSPCCTCFCFLDLSLEEKSVPAGKVDTEHRAEALPHAPPSLLGVLTEDGGDTAVESEVGEVRQLPKHGDSVSGVGGDSLLCLCLAVELVWVWVIPPPLGMIHSKGNWQGCVSNALGRCLIKPKAHKMPTKRQRGAAVNFRGVLLRPYFIRASSGLFGGQQGDCVNCG